jgi:hypothetical protein
MRHTILTALGVLVAIAEFTTSVQAQPKVSSNPETGQFTLSGNSLVGIESRTVEDDFNKFFLEDSSTLQLNSSRNNNDLINRNGVVWQISENVQLVANRPIYPSVNPVPWRQHLPLTNQPLNSAERVEVQLSLD